MTGWLLILVFVVFVAVGARPEVWGYHRVRSPASD